MFCFFYLTVSCLTKVNAISDYFINNDSINAYIYFISKGCNKVWGFSGNGYSTMKLGDNISGTYNFGTNYGSINLFERDTNYVVTFPQISGNYRSLNAYDNQARLYWDHKSPMYMEFFSSKQVDVSTSFTYGENGKRGNLTLLSYNYIAGNANLFHYIYKYTPTDSYYSLNFNFYAGSSDLNVIPIFLKYETELSNSERTRVGLSTVETAAINNLQSSNDENFKKQLEQAKKQHDEQMDTSKVTEVNGIADSLQKVGNEKTKSLLYPVQWAIDTAHNLASAPGTGTISIPVIFGSGSFDIDLTVIERNVPSVWSFIQNFIRFIVSLGIIRGILALFKGVDG